MMTAVGQSVFVAFASLAKQLVLFCAPFHHCFSLRLQGNRQNQFASLASYIVLFKPSAFAVQVTPNGSVLHTHTHTLSLATKR
eukprot:6085408-Amphidinium_carterae.2